MIDEGHVGAVGLRDGVVRPPGNAEIALGERDADAFIGGSNSTEGVQGIGTLRSVIDDDPAPAGVGLVQ